MGRHTLPTQGKPKSARGRMPHRILGLWIAFTLLLAGTTAVIASSWFTTPRPTLVISPLAPSNQVAALPFPNNPHDCFAHGWSGGGEFRADYGAVQLSQRSLDTLPVATEVFSAHQLPKPAIAAILANGLAESGGDPSAIQRGGQADSPTDPRLGYGFFQWAGDSYQDQLRQFAELHRLPASDLRLQFEFFWQTLRDAPSWTDASGCIHDPLEDLKITGTQKGPESATLVVCAEYIYRTPNCDDTLNGDLRVAYARTILPLLK